MKSSKEFNTCLHFDMNDPTHRKAVEILTGYEKKKFHSYTNLVAIALTEYSARQDMNNTEEIVNALIPKIREIVKTEISNSVESPFSPNAVSVKDEKSKIVKYEENEDPQKPGKEKIMNSMDSSFMSAFSTKIDLGT